MSLQNCSIQAVFCYLVILFTLAGCSHVSEPVIGDQSNLTIYHQRPPQPYQTACHIHLDLNAQSMPKSDFDYQQLLDEQAKQCDVEHVIIQAVSLERVDAMGIELLPKLSKFIDLEFQKRLFNSIGNHQIEDITHLLQDVSENPTERTQTDNEILNQGLYYAAAAGLDCNDQIVNILHRHYGAYIPTFEAEKLPYVKGKRSRENTIFCQNVLLNSFQKMDDKALFALELNRHFVDKVRYLNFEPDMMDKLDKYHSIFQQVNAAITENCQVEPQSELCQIRVAYSRTGKSLRKLLDSMSWSNDYEVKVLENLSSIAKMLEAV